MDINFLRPDTSSGHAFIVGIDEMDNNNKPSIYGWRKGWMD
jgi:hypothetical protein